MVRDPTGPREDTGFVSRTDPGLELVRRLYNYAKSYAPKAKVGTIREKGVGEAGRAELITPAQMYLPTNTCISIHKARVFTLP